MRNLKDGQKIFFILLLAWLVINWLQAAFTELDPDEAYYWMYSKVLDWGYFDHPPFLAVLINVGYGLFPSELGVRFMIALLQPVSFYFIWLILDKPTDRSRIFLLVSLMAAMPLFQVYGFIATPDGPLLFFSSVFIYAYKRFIDKDNLLNTLFLGVCMAALLYSKYHGLLLILFITASNLKLFTRKNFYVAGILGVVLFLPHLYWQYIHDFPSFRYHLSGRDDPYELKHTTNYLINQLVLFSPFLFPLIVYSLYKTKVNSVLVRAYYFIIFGFWAFFLWTTSKGHVEPQWTAILSIPFVILLFEFSKENHVFELWLRRLSYTTIALLLVGRLLIVFPILNIKSEFHNRQWVDDLKEKAKGKPLIFENTYRDVSKYTFYSGNLAYTFTDLDYRRNQFDIWDWEKNLQDKDVLFIGQRDWKCNNCELLELGRKKFMIKYADNLQVSQKVEFILPDKKLSWKQGSQIDLPCQIVNPYEHQIGLDIGTMKLGVEALFHADAIFQDSIPVSLNLKEPFFPANDTLNCIASFVVSDSLIGPFDFTLGIRTGDLPVAFNSKPQKIIIVEE